MTNKKTPAACDQEILGTKAEYFRISKAAEILGCSSDDILHQGAIGKAEIQAPVVSGGDFEWIVGNDVIAFSELDTPFLRTFDATDRVILQERDLAHIEGVGWVIPHCLSAPYAAIERIDWFLDYLSEPNSTDKAGVAQKIIILNELKNHKTSSPWTSFFPAGYKAKKTTIDHLFIGKLELLRILEGRPQGNSEIERNRQANETPEAINGSIERYAKPREEVLRAAIFFLKTKPDQCALFTEWANLIETNARDFWPKTGVPPMKFDEIERLLSKASKGDLSVRRGSSAN